MFRSLSPRSWPRTLLLMTESSTYSPVLSLVRELVQAAIDPARKPTRTRVRTRRALFNTVCLHIHREAGRAHDLPGSAFHQSESPAILSRTSFPGGQEGPPSG